MMKSVFTSLGLLGAAVPAFACPTVEDLGKGIEFRTADGDVEVHRQLRPDWVTIAATYSGGDGSILEMYLGIYLLSVIPIELGVPRPGDREDYASISDLSHWKIPVPNASWVNTTPGGGQAVSGPMETTMIAGCRYNSFKVLLQYPDDDTYKETYDYLPDLGVGLLEKTEASDGIDTYSYISVRILE